MKGRFTLVLIVIALVAVVLPPNALSQDQSETQTVSQSATGFALDLYRQFVASPERQTENLFFSPYSIYTFLALMYGGAGADQRVGRGEYQGADQGDRELAAFPWLGPNRHRSYSCPTKGATCP